MDLTGPHGHSHTPRRCSARSHISCDSKRCSLTKETRSNPPHSPHSSSRKPHSSESQGLRMTDSGLPEDIPSLTEIDCSHSSPKTHRRQTHEKHRGCRTHEPSNSKRNSSQGNPTGGGLRCETTPASIATPPSCCWCRPPPMRVTVRSIRIDKTAAGLHRHNEKSTSGRWSPRWHPLEDSLRTHTAREGNWS
jgi:hypothetical protein